MHVKHPTGKEGNCYVTIKEPGVRKPNITVKLIGTLSILVFKVTLYSFAVT
jgi:hypothetical protein